MAFIPLFPKGEVDYSAEEVGAALASLVVRDVDGIPCGGLLRQGPVVTGVPSAWQLRVAPFMHVRGVTASLDVSGVSAPEFVDVSPAPASGGRIDLVLWDAQASDLTVLPGVPSASPVPPVPVPGLEVLAEWHITAGAVHAGQGTVTERFRHAAVMGQPIVMRTKPELEDFNAVNGTKALCLADGFTYERLNGVWVGGRYMLTLLAPLKVWQPGDEPYIEVSDGMCSLGGALSSNTPSGLAKQNVQHAANIPDFLRPAGKQTFVAQANYDNRMACIVGSDGKLEVGRFGPAAPPGNPWLPLYGQWQLNRRG